MIDLSDEQENVREEIMDFIHDQRTSKQYFVLHGLAGTGKSTLLAQIAQELPFAQICAFTGKAASVLSRKTGLRCTTIHSFLYRFLGFDDENEPIFRPKIADGQWEGDVALVDESSTVGKFLARDLLATGCKVIASGDNGQLPPVRDTQFFSEADTVLFTVHRQAWNSPIIRQAHAVRSGRAYQTDGEDFIVTRHIAQEQALAADIVLCWRNVTRIEINRLSRAYRGLSGPLKAGEPVMCLKNDHKRAILNGAVYPLLRDRTGDLVYIQNERGEKITVRSWVEDSDAPIDPADLEDLRLTPFAPAYCATVHKAQGSEWDRVILIDDYGREDYARWAYTGITRAAKSIIVQRG